MYVTGDAVLVVLLRSQTYLVVQKNFLPTVNLVPPGLMIVLVQHNLLPLRGYVRVGARPLSCPFCCFFLVPSSLLAISLVSVGVLTRPVLYMCGGGRDGSVSVLALVVVIATPGAGGGV